MGGGASKRAKLQAFNEYVKAGTGPLVPGAPGTLTLQTLVGGKQKSLPAIAPRNT